jgi:hypothetical protein
MATQERDYVALELAAEQFEMPQPELYDLVRAGEVLGKRVQVLDELPAGWYVDRASLANYRRGDAGAGARLHH